METFSDALDNRFHPFWWTFWSKVQQEDATRLRLPQVVDTITESTKDGTLYLCRPWLWAGASTRDGYGRVVSGVGGEMLAPRVAWSFLHMDPVPANCIVGHRDTCQGGNPCVWVGCLVLRPARGCDPTDPVLQKIIRAYASDYEYELS